MTQEKLNEILDKHSKWLNEEDGGERADLRDTDLRNADLSYSDLRDTDLRGADLRYSEIRHANLRGADFRGADLSYSDLSYSDLRGTDFCGTDLSYSDLRYSKIRHANLRGADLTQAVYTDTLLNLQCPEEGSFIAWKKLFGNQIAKLLIPEDAKRSSATTRKCRASKAVVLAIYNKDGEEIGEGRSQRYHYEFVYRVGETVYADSWDEDRWNECSNGIHFFITRREAEEY